MKKRVWSVRQQPQHEVHTRVTAREKDRLREMVQKRGETLRSYTRRAVIRQLERDEEA